MSEKENSPFTPGSPVPVQLFIGRGEQIKEVNRYIKRCLSGKQDNVFLIGDRGIGKSSLASFVRHQAPEEVIALHVFLGKVTTLEEMVFHIFDQLIKETSSRKWFGKIRNLFADTIKEIKLLGISVGFNPKKDDLRNLVLNFPSALHNVLKEISNIKKGLVIILDDINGLSKNEDFANWYKSFVDTVATHHSEFPVFMMLTGTPENRDALAQIQPSLMRIFRPLHIEKLSNQEVESFFENAFGSANIKVESSAMREMVKFSSGLPILMHEIGDAVYWFDKDGMIDDDDAIFGVINAANNVGKKYLDPQLYRILRSKRYFSILRKIPETSISRKFYRKDIVKALNDSEKKVLDNFLRRLRDLGILEKDIEDGPGAYKFVNEIYPVFIWMESKFISKKKQ